MDIRAVSTRAASLSASWVKGVGLDKYGVSLATVLSFAHERATTQGILVMQSTNCGSLEQLLRLQPLSSTFHDQVVSILGGSQREHMKRVKSTRGDDLVELVEYLDGALYALDPVSPGFRLCLRELRSICGAWAISPTSSVLSPQALSVNLLPVASRIGFYEYEGFFNNLRVYIKRVKGLHPNMSSEIKEFLCKEATLWKHLEHKNLVPVLGVTTSPLQIVSKWMHGWYLREYIREYPDTCRPYLLCGVAEGLHFLHSLNIVHGDLKGPNIVVDGSGNARITGIGLTKFTRGNGRKSLIYDDEYEPPRWTAPEIFEHDGPDTVESDVYSFGAVAIEVFTGEIPFKAVKSLEVIMCILNGERPKRPSHPKFTDNLWKLTQQCWVGRPKDRPKMEDVVKALTAGKLPDISPASATGSNLTMVSPGSNTGGMPPVSSTSEGQVRSDNDNAGSDSSPPAPTKVGKDDHPTNTFVGRNTTVSSPGRLSGPDEDSWWRGRPRLREIEDGRKVYGWRAFLRFPGTLFRSQPK